VPALKIVIIFTVTNRAGNDATHETFGSGSCQGEFEELQD
jgi:hypothetical protein